MSDYLEYKETITLVKLAVNDDYGYDYIEEQERVPAIIEWNTGHEHANFQDAIVSDAIVYLDPENDYVIENSYRLEEFAVIIDLFDQDQSQAWFKITSATVARDHLLENQIDNVRCTLKKISEITNVS